MNIGISNDVHAFSNSNSWNGMYSVKVIKGNIMLFASMSISQKTDAMTVEDVVRDIWMNYIQPYV